MSGAHQGLCKELTHILLLEIQGWTMKMSEQNAFWNIFNHNFCWLPLPDASLTLLWHARGRGDGESSRFESVVVFFSSLTTFLLSFLFPRGQNQCPKFPSILSSSTMTFDDLESGCMSGLLWGTGFGMLHDLGDGWIMFSLITPLPSPGDRHAKDYLKRLRMGLCDKG